MVYDCVVLGVGGVGSAALRGLARRGMRVLGIERLAPGHDRGSSHGRTRMIRQAYFEHPDYVPLVLEAYRMWRELEGEARRDLLTITGLLQVGPADGAVLGGVAESARRFDLTVERLSRSQIERRWDGIRAPQEMEGIFEPTGGVLAVEDCVKAMADSALAAGAELRCGVVVERWSVEPGEIRLETSHGDVRARRMVVTAGPWAPGLLSELGVSFSVRRKPQCWFPAEESYRASAGFPAFLFDLPQGAFYGFPVVDGQGLKAAEHSGGRIVDDPTHVDRALDNDDLARVVSFLRACLPRVGSEPIAHSVCMYTMSPDGHFVVDRLPGHPEIAVAAGLSGHGFKFAPVLGEALADLICEGASQRPIAFLAQSRPGVGPIAACGGGTSR